MATMIPESIPFDAYESERRVFRLLREAPDTDAWWVIWSYRPRQFELESGRRREIDFLVLMPGAGILCLEVKGGQYEIRQGVWYPAGNRESVERPDRQSEQAMFALRNELLQQFNANNDIKSLPLDFAVAFTAWEWPKGLEAPAPLIYDKSVVDHPDSFVSRLADDAAKLKSPVQPGRRSVRPLNDSTIKRLADYLAPNFRLNAGPQLDVISEQLIRLTQEQYMVLDMFAENPRCLVKGAAGTGKTMLSLEYARRARKGAPASGCCVSTCYWAIFLKEQARDCPGISAGGFWPDIMRPLILESPFRGQFLRDEESSADETALYAHVYPRYANLALTESGPRFDVLAVDEAPDLCLGPYLELMDLLLAGGLRGGHWAMFGDFSHQAIFPGSESGPESVLLPYQPARVTLRVNCRNARPIARDTARIADSDLPETRQIEGPRPQYRYWQDAAELPGLLDDEVHRLLSQSVRIEEIVVLSEHRLEDSGLDPARTYGGYRLVTYRRGQRAEMPGEIDDGTPRLKFCAIPAFKGMESEVVILLLGRLEAGGEVSRPFDPRNARAYAYIGMSRARGALAVLAHAGLRGELEARLSG